MSFWILMQILVDLIVVAGVIGTWMRFHRPHKDDPRLSKGLQLLQSKIAVLEDLSDRTEIQVHQLTTLLEQKCRDIQAQVQNSDRQLQKIDQSMQKSLEVAKIFQDRIPHTEILERQNTIKYVKAARLAHQGLSPEEIAAQVDLSTGEIEFIAKVNRDQLMFCADSLPEWAQSSTEPSALNLEGQDVDNFQETRIDLDAPLSREVPVDLSKAFEVPKPDQDALKKLGDAFRQACETANHLQEVTQGFVEENRTSEPTPLHIAPQTKAPKGQVRTVTFPRIDANNY
ncbi:MAG: DUF2802 domain-containing protein [Proteobacteria bacterium]|nr:MAG: DUF2802 domain-containing protein [Pseudomonadota bacterium]